MYSITICFGPAGTVWNFLFKSEESVQAARDSLISSDNRVVFHDDFGQAANFDATQIHATMTEDLEVSQMAQVERGLHQARSQAKAQTRAMADPVIKESLRAQQMGPAVMSPMPGGRFS